jgi:hypothetical protein
MPLRTLVLGAGFAGLEGLGQLRDQFARAGREDMEDLMLDAMDMVSGWSARAVRI